MKQDIQQLLAYLRLFVDTFNHSNINLMSDEDDLQMIQKIKQIATKRNLKF